MTTQGTEVRAWRLKAGDKISLPVIDQSVKEFSQWLDLTLTNVHLAEFGVIVIYISPLDGETRRHFFRFNDRVKLLPNARP